MKTALEYVNATNLRRTELITESGYELIEKAINEARADALRLATERAKERFHKGDYDRVNKFFQTMIDELN